MPLRHAKTKLGFAALHFVRAIDYDSTSWSLVCDGQWDVNGLVYRKIVWECLGTSLGIMFSYLQISWSYCEQRAMALAPKWGVVRRTNGWSSLASDHPFFWGVYMLEPLPLDIVIRYTVYSNIVISGWWEWNKWLDISRGWAFLLWIL